MTRNTIRGHHAAHGDIVTCHGSDRTPAKTGIRCVLVKVNGRRWQLRRADDNRTVITFDASQRLWISKEAAR